MKSLMMKFFVGLLVVSISLGAAAKSDTINFHLACDNPSPECVEFSFAEQGSGKLLVTKEPAFVLREGDVNAAFPVVLDESGRKAYTLVLNEVRTKEFAEFTENNVRKVIAITWNQKILTAPLLNESITEGRILIESGVSGDDIDSLDQVPWLQSKIGETKKADQSKNRSLVFFFMGFSILILGGAVYLAFCRKGSQA